MPVVSRSRTNSDADLMSLQTVSRGGLILTLVFTDTFKALSWKGHHPGGGGLPPMTSGGVTLLRVNSLLHKDLGL